MSIKQLAIGMTACAFVCSTQIAQAEKLIVEVEATSSIRLYADYTFQDCCDLDSVSTGESTIYVGTCETLGGYCVTGKKVALWNFALPSFPENAALLSATFDGRHNAGNTPFYYRGRWYPNSSLGYSEAINTWNSSDFLGTASSSGGYFSVPLNIDLFGGQFADDYLVLTGYQGSGLSFYNSGTLAPTLRIIVDIPNDSAKGHE